MRQFRFFGLLACAMSVQAQTFVPTIIERRELITARTVERIPKDRQTEADAVDKAQNDERDKLQQMGEKSEQAIKTAAFEAGCRKVSGLVNRWRPTRWAAYRTACFWAQPDAESLKTATVAGNSTNGTAAVEVVSDLFWGVRVAVLTAVSGAKSDTTMSEDDVVRRRLQELSTSGGNLSFMASYPWYLHDSAVASPKMPESSVQELFSSYVRVGTVVPALGESTETGASRTLDFKDLNAHLELAIGQADVRIGGATGGLNFVSFAKVCLVDGTKLFRSAVGHNSRNPFGYVQAGMGARVSSVFYLLASWTKYSGGLKSPGATLTLGFGK